MSVPVELAFFCKVARCAGRSKYGNRRTVVNGITFASLREADAYSTLLLREKVGDIRRLTLQPKFPITLNGISVCTYIADFRYEERSRIDEFSDVVADAKGMRTPVYQLKKKLVKAVYGIDIVEL